MRDRVEEETTCRLLTVLEVHEVVERGRQEGGQGCSISLGMARGELGRHHRQAKGREGVHLTPSVLRHIFIFTLLIICRFYTAPETHVGIDIVQTLAIYLLASIDPS